MYKKKLKYTKKKFRFFLLEINECEFVRDASLRYS
jgi:hypothetical protein